MNNVMVTTECVDKCREVFGFSAQWVFKLIAKKSELEPNKSNEDSAKEILEFTKNIESMYGTEFRRVMDMILIDRCSLKQYMFRNIDNLEKMYGVLEGAYPDIKDIRFSTTKIDPMKAYFNLGVVGRKA